MARLLIEKGYREVRPLLGGFDGWVELGYPTEPVAAQAPVVPAIAAASASA
jgi:3-mercaptopyruvate sulfurtransferase SseA